MSNKWLKLIAGIEVIGGIFGIFLLILAFSVRPTFVFGVKLSLGGVLYVGSILGGWWLWKGMARGAALSKIILVLQIPVIIFWNIRYKFVSGLSVPIIVRIDGSGFFMGFSFHLSSWIFSFQHQPYQFSLGVNLIALVAFLYLWYVTKSISKQRANSLPSLTSK